MALALGRAHHRRRVLGGDEAAVAGAPMRGGRSSSTAKREKLFTELVRLEQQKRAGSVDAARYAERRTALIAQLERVYRDLDAQGGQGAAA